MAVDEARGYKTHYRIIEWLGILTFLGGAASLLIFQTLSLDYPWYFFILNFILAALAADLMTGLVHWFADTWGTPQWPVVGGAFIRPFREHHWDEKLITTHDFVETNGNNCIASLPFLLAAYLLSKSESSTLHFASNFLLLMSLWGFGTNQFHKWAHMDHPPRWVSRLQDRGLILSPRHHSIHHTAPFEHHYAITNGWTNAFTRRIGFYRFLERMITLATSAKPRDYAVAPIIERALEET